ncbi:hypothetical protein LXA43DRAFT_1142675 [Ganoderma leucocontextum]|nr:hypothetical protein LXA43DRAFT_1142675 [Ganoderma leucocontextum]
MPAPDGAPSTLSNQKQHVAKIDAVLTAISQNKWSSINEFLLAFYTCQDPKISTRARRSIAYTEKKVFPPRQIMDAWFSCPNLRPKTKHELGLAVTEKAAAVMVEESSRACKEKSLQLSSTGVDIESLTVNLALRQLAETFQRLLPCLWLLLTTLLMATNTYERKNKKEKIGKADTATRICVVVISILLHARNRATDVFQLVMGIFLSSTGASRRVMSTFNHMGISVSYDTVQKALQTLTDSATLRAQDFVRNSQRLGALVYDNINFTLRKASQRLDNMTEQLNATTSAVFALPARFTRAVYHTALSVVGRDNRAHLRSQLTLDSLMPSEELQARLVDVFKHHVRSILLSHSPGLRKRNRVTRRLRKQARLRKPCIRVVSSEKTEFFPLPALAQEEASVQGTIRVVTKIFKGLLELAEELIDSELRLLVGDWLSIRNLRLMKEEVSYELTSFARMGWIQEASMPFHFQLNAMYMLFRTHLGHPNDNNPSSLEHHRTLLRRAKLDTKKPEYNKARQLVEHSLVARIIDCTRVALSLQSHSDLRSWKPDWDEFEDIVSKVIAQFVNTSAGHSALLAGDEVLASSIFFNRDALLFREFSEAIRDGDVGRMWVVLDFWVFMMRGAGCHNYGNEILEMKAQYQHIFTPELREIVERTWLVNRWGKEGRCIPADLYLEHNNGFLKNMFAAMGSNASIEHIQHKSSACVEVLRDIAHDVSQFFGLNDYRRGHREVSAHGDIMALLVDLGAQNIHTFTSQRHVPPPPSKSKRTQKRETGVRDVLQEGMFMLTHRNLYRQWLERSGKGGTGLYDGDAEWHNDSDVDVDVDIYTGTAFDDPNGTLDVDVNLDDDEEACPNGDVDVPLV